MLHRAPRRARPKVCAILRASAGLAHTPFEDSVSVFLQLLNVTSSLDLKGLLMSFGHALFLKRPDGTSQLQHVLLGAGGKGLELRIQIRDASAALSAPTDLPACSTGDMLPRKYNIAPCKGQTSLSSPLI